MKNKTTNTSTKTDTKKQKQQPIYTRLTFQERKRVQKLLSIHCDKIQWISGATIKESDFGNIKREVIVGFDFKKNGLSLIVICSQPSKRYKKQIEPKTFLKQIKAFNDNLQNNNNGSNPSSGNNSTSSSNSNPGNRRKSQKEVKEILQRAKEKEQANKASKSVKKRNKRNRQDKSTLNLFGQGDVS